MTVEKAGQSKTYNLECILPYNLYNDKFFAIFSILFPIIGLLNLINLNYWVWINSKWGRRDFLKKFLVDPLDLDYDNCEIESDLRIFSEEYLRRDGIFILQIVEMNVGNLTVETLLEALWNAYLDEKEAAQEEAVRKKEQLLDSVAGTPLTGRSRRSSMIRNRILSRSSRESVFSGQPVSI